ncbi:MAG: hypothetical protein D3923_02415 [Candidatus Electrothrix sp. AR3]|nr:hypothetical protein [Candidatus Electrothrix sp. AR3]
MPKAGNDMDHNDRTFDFLIFAISDLQSTIKAIDAKVSILIALIMIPFASLSKIYSVCIEFIKICNTLNILIIIIFSILWISSFFCLLRVLFPKNNPKDKICGDIPCGLFFLGNDYFKLDIFDCLLGTKKTSILTFNQHLEKIQEKSGSFIDELAFEQMKLAYILNTKLILYRWGAVLAVVWAALGGWIWLIKLST